jgi:hypothetical protein
MNMERSMHVNLICLHVLSLPASCVVQAKSAEEGLKFVRTVLQAADASKKPSSGDFQAFLAPLVKIIEKGSNPDSRADTFNQQKAWAEGQAGAVAWIQVDPASAGMTPKQVRRTHTR